MAKLDSGRLLLGFIFVLLLPNCIVYESKTYKPFGFRYWLGWVAWILYLPLFFLISYLVFSPLNWKFLWSGQSWISFLLVGIWLGILVLLVFYLKTLLRRTRYYRQDKRRLVE